MSDSQGTMDRMACDVVVVGSGAAGLTAALTASSAGLSVIVIEKSAVWGGTTALSEGMVWIPGSRQANQRGVRDRSDDALAYIEYAAGPLFEPDRTRAFLEAAPQMLAFVEAAGGPRFTLATGSMDYHPEWPGASIGARSLVPGIFDARQLGDRFAGLRRPLHSTMVFGGMTISSGELPIMRRAHREPAAAWHAARVLARHALDRVTGYPRGARIANGNGLVAALAAAGWARGVRLLTETRLTALLSAGGRIRGVVAATTRGDVEILTRRGVVLAGGGFSGSARMRQRFFPDGAQGSSHVRIVPESIEGDGLRLAEGMGAKVVAGSNVAAWAPASRVPLPHGEEGFPHFMERQKPGFIAVNGCGRRFVNEATSYSLFVQAMLANARRGEPDCWLIADRPAMRRHGLGAVPPFPLGIGAFLKSGYLVEADDLDGLAARMGMHAETLCTTVTTFNRYAVEGRDPEFNRGSSAIDRAYGDAAHPVHPNLGPLATPPFYAVRLHSGDIGSLAGLASDAQARVLGVDGQPFIGLCVAGNDSASLFGGTYPAGGITLGPAMTFGWIAARTLASLEPLGQGD